MDEQIVPSIEQLGLCGIEDEDLFEPWKVKVKEYIEDRDSQFKEFNLELPQDLESLKSSHFNAIGFTKELIEGSIHKEYKEIVELSLKELVSKISEGSIKSTVVLEAYVSYAAIAQRFTNCVCQIFLEEARERAKFLDSYLLTHGKPLGPFHGIPISVKEHIPFKGKITHCSYVSLLDNIPQENQVSIQMLYDMGAVFYVRTNQPQSLMAIDSHNNITGPTLNPYNLALSAGGSTAGEGALLAFKGSIIGIGSDIGGSLRVPASFTGTVGYKPTTRRFSCRDGIVLGDSAIDGVYGPMCRSVDDLEYFMDIYINKGKPWMFDESVIPCPWNNCIIPPTAITIAVIYDNGIVRPTPPITRGLDYVTSKLRNAGIKVIFFEPPKSIEAAQCINNLYHAYGTEYYVEKLKKSGEPILKLTKWQLAFGPGAKGLALKQLEETTKLKNEISRIYFDYAKDNNITAILGPISESVAPISNSGYNWSYTNIYNLIDWPAVAFPTGLVQDPKLDVWGPDHQSNYTSPLEQFCHELYNADEVVGAPIGLQVAAPPFRDETVIGVAAIISKILKSK